MDISKPQKGLFKAMERKEESKHERGFSFRKRSLSKEKRGRNGFVGTQANKPKINGISQDMEALISSGISDIEMKEVMVTAEVS